LGVRAAGFGAREGNTWAREVVGLGGAWQSRTRCCGTKERRREKEGADTRDRLVREIERERERARW
jgi:hypothetical protein